MIEQDLFLMADASLRDVIDMVDLDQLDRKVPANWSSKPDQTLRDIIQAHAYDEAWVPDVLAGATTDDVGTKYDGDLLGDDPIGSYDRLNDAATEAATQELDPGAIVHLSYGDFPVATFFEHTTGYRAFQAWSIAHFVGLDFSLPDPLVDGLWDQVLPEVEQWRAMGIFGPEVEVPADADKETQLLGKVGYWLP
jgi:hypothetical protein